MQRGQEKVGQTASNRQQVEINIPNKLPYVTDLSDIVVTTYSDFCAGKFMAMRFATIRKEDFSHLFSEVQPHLKQIKNKPWGPGIKMHKSYSHVGRKR